MPQVDLTPLKLTLRRWWDRVFDREERRNYLATEGLKSFFILAYILLSIALFIEACIRWGNRATALGKRSVVWIVIARGFGQLLNFNCALIILPVMRSVLSLLRTVKLNKVLPLDKNIIFHRYIAQAIVVCSLLHGMAHYFNYSCCPEAYKPSYMDKFAEYTTAQAMWVNKYGITGNIIVLVMVVMYSAAGKNYRLTNNFTVFWYSHHLFVVFFVALLIHGKNFWKWFMIPGCLYLLERILRIIRGNSLTIVKKVHFLKSGVLFIELEKRGFHYKAGQYCFLNCPTLSKHEWHPFTISSAPEEEYTTFHIRCVGDWTRALADFLNPGKRSTVKIDKPFAPDGRTAIIRVDGPFGAPAEHVFDYPYIMLIAAGIGVTPYASILKHIRNKFMSGDRVRTKKVFFYWINRDEGSWEWFHDILVNLEENNGDKFEIHTYFTGEVNVDDIRLIVFSSQEYRENKDKGTQQAAGVESLARAIYDYEPEASDEIELKENDTIKILEQDDSGWWKGKNTRSGQTGLFPCNYVKILDKVTKLSDNKNRHYGRPVWTEIFSNVRQQVEQDPEFVSSITRPKIGTFFCGPAVLSKQLYRFCVTESKIGKPLFTYHKENF